MSTLDTPVAGRRVNQSELARELGVSRQAVSDLVKRQVLVVGPDKLLDLDAARAVIRERVRPTGKTAAAAAPAVAQAPALAPPAGEKPADAAAGYYVAKAQREASEAGIAALKLQQMQGALIDRDAAIQASFNAFRQLRNSLGFLPRKLGGLLVGKTSPRDIQLRLEDEIRTVLDDFQRTLLASAAARMGGVVPPDDGEGR